jgi:hypothetical protein
MVGAGVIRANALALALLGAGLLVGCGGGPPPPPVFPDLTFAHRGQLVFDAGRIDVVDEFYPPLKPPHVEHEMPLKLAAGAAKWAKDRLSTAGKSRRLVKFAIKTAQVIESELPRTGGLRGALTVEQAQRYDAELEVMIELLSPTGFREAYATASVRRSATVPETITLNGRQQVLFTLAEQTLREMDAELERNVRRYMGGHLR